MAHARGSRWIVALALGAVGVAALTPPPAPKNLAGIAAVKEVVAPLAIETAAEPLLAAPPSRVLCERWGPTYPAATARPEPIPDEVEEAVRQRSAEEQQEKKEESTKPCTKKQGDWYKFGFQGQEPNSKADFDELVSSSKPTAPADGEENENGMAKELAGFTLPLLLVWLASPLLSLVDTAAVGASRPTAELAILGPACAACDNAAFLCAAPVSCISGGTFLGIVTTGAVSRALATGDEGKATTASGAACVAALTVGGLLTAVALSPLGPAGLGAMVPRTTPGFEAAVAYVRIRSIAFVPALLIMVLQSTSLARRNVRAPLKAAGLSGAANLIGDGILVPTMGLAGAALATTLAQLVALIGLGGDAVSGNMLPKKPKQWLESAGRPFRQIFTKGAPVVAALSAKTAVLLSLSYAAASSAAKNGNLADLAAHQILVGLYFVFAPVGDALSQTVQTFLPRSIVADQLDDAKNPALKKSRALGPKSRAVVKGAVAAAVVLGGLDALIAAGIPAFLPTLFTRDPAVAAALRRTAPYLGSALMVHGLSSATEGTMLANRDAGVLGGLYAVDAAVVVYAFFAVAAAAGPVTSVWRVFLGYNLLRCGQFAARVCSTALRRRKDAVPAPEPSK